MPASITSAKPGQSIKRLFKHQQNTSRLWRQEGPQARLKRLIKLQKWIREHRKDIQDAIYKDFKKPAEEVDLSEVYVVLSELKHAISNLRKWSRPRKVEAPLALVGSQSLIQYEPKGVCLIIAPWNFPFNLSVAPLVSALAAGNTVILKPSELTPNCSQLVENMVLELFEPSEVAVFQGDKHIAQQLLRLPFDHIFFTGSPAVGKIVMKAAAQHLTSVTLELGGKSPVIVDSTADLADTAEKIAWGKFINCGQTCIAPDYLLVDKEVEEELIDELRLAIDRLFDGEGLGIENSTDYARIINREHFDRINMLLEDALDQGAILETGGLSDHTDHYLAPTLISRVPSNSLIMEKEIFGPVLPVLTYEHLEEAISTINERPKPLALYLFSRSQVHKNAVLTQTSSGSVAINDCVVQFMNPYLPFGGTNHSGFGKSHGFRGFQAFSNEKGIVKQKVGLTSVKPVYPPYTNLVRSAIDLLLKYF
ncbi:MAG: aldehyde dehydrogenase family protein [Cyclobacteriaceae bacterium]|nr:aldehyde dehydrogenase family protein [Cyclobacteriaceae bacterium]